MTSAGSLQPAGDIQMYVEIDGDGPDLVLLHGGGGNIDDLAGLRSVLRQGRRLILPEQRAHGRTPDVGTISYAQMAADTAALLDGLGVGSADLVGWSDGGIIAMMVARDRPELVAHVVAIGANVDADGAPAPMSAEVSDWFANATPADFDFDLPIEAKEKLLAMWRIGADFTVADLAHVAPPVLLIAGDRDLVTLEHTVAMFNALPDVRLAILPGADHRVPQSRPDTVAALILAFLAETPTAEPGD